jgi:hypothetical protein
MHDTQPIWVTLCLNRLFEKKFPPFPTKLSLSIACTLTGLRRKCTMNFVSLNTVVFGKIIARIVTLWQTQFCRFLWASPKRLVFLAEASLTWKLHKSTLQRCLFAFDTPKCQHICISFSVTIIQVIHCQLD